MNFIAHDHLKPEDGIWFFFRKKQIVLLSEQNLVHLSTDVLVPIHIQY